MLELLIESDKPERSQLTATLPPGDWGIDATLAAMRAVAKDAARFSSHVRSLAARIAATSPNKDFDEQIAAVHRFLRESIKFKRDLFGTEQLRHPDDLLAEIDQYGQTVADCDDLATLAAAVIRALGFAPVFIVVGRRKRFEHVFPGVRRGDAVIPLDAQEGLPPGTWPKRMKRIKVVGA